MELISQRKRFKLFQEFVPGIPIYWANTLSLDQRVTPWPSALGSCVSMSIFFLHEPTLLDVDFNTNPKDSDKASVTTLMSSVTPVDRYRGTNISQIMQVV